MSAQRELCPGPRPPPPVAPWTMTTDMYPAPPSTNKCAVKGPWHDGVEPVNSSWSSCVDNTMGPTEVLIWCCNKQGTYTLARGQSTCGRSEDARTDIDNVRDVSGQWWKFGNGVRANVQPDGTVEFYGIQSLDLLPVFRDNFVENFEPRYWGRIDNCGEDYNNR